VFAATLGLVRANLAEARHQIWIAYLFLGTRSTSSRIVSTSNQQ
jgi:hypothetical protein